MANNPVKDLLTTNQDLFTMARSLQNDRTLLCALLEEMYDRLEVIYDAPEKDHSHEVMEMMKHITRVMLEVSE